MADRSLRRWQRLVLILVRRIWFRAAVFSVAAVALALVAAWVGPFIPYDISASIGAKSVDHILDILASSMLAVTTFSLTAMVSAFSGVTTTSSSRATALLIEDSRAQNALSTFLGAFLFSIVGICALSTGFYGETGRVLLFAGTMLVIGFIVVTLLRWIQHLSTFGRMDDVIERVEKVAILAARRLHAPPAVDVSPPAPPPGMVAVTAERTGYVTHIDLKGLERLGGRHDARFMIASLPGRFVVPDQPLVWTDMAGGEDAIRDCLTIERMRSFDQDIRFGVVVLGEIASRALSPAVNDPGTAIAAIDAGLRVFEAADRTAEEGAGERVTIPPIAYRDMLTDLFRPIARDGAGTVEVAIRLQRALASLAAQRPDAAALLRAAGADAFARAERAIEHPGDVAALRDARARYWPTTG